MLDKRTIRHEQQERWHTSEAVYSDIKPTTTIPLIENELAGVIIIAITTRQSCEDDGFDDSDDNDVYIKAGNDSAD